MYAENTKTEIRFTNEAAANEAKAIVAKTLNSMDCDFSFNNAVSHAVESLHVDGSTLMIPQGGAWFLAEELVDVFPLIVKAIATQLPHEDFSFEVAGYDDYAEGWIDGCYADGNLEINSTFYPMGYCEYVSCPECGEDVVRLDEYIPGKLYPCPECGELVDLTEQYEEVAPVIKKEQIKIF